LIVLAALTLAVSVVSVVLTAVLVTVLGDLVDRIRRRT